jgi:VWFA-related protein
MAKLSRVIAATALVAALAAVQPGHAQQQPAGQPQEQAPPQAPPPPTDASGQPIFRTGINFVRVDVIVADRNGNPVGDLKPEDFEVTEQGKPQAIETFKLVSLDGGLQESTKEPPREIRTDIDEETEAARDDVRLFAFFLDDYHVRRESSMQAREQLTRFVETQLGPTDMVGVMYPLEATASVRMTRNHDAIMRGLQQFEGRKYDYTPRNQYEEQYAYYPAETVERIRNEVSMSAMKALIVHMGGLKEGRKALILVSEGYSNLLPPQLRDPVAAMPGIGNPNRGDPFAGANSPLEDRASFSASMDLESDLREIYDLANRNNVAIYAVDPRGLATGEFGIDQNIGQSVDRQYLTSTMETLRTLALNTDGRAIVNRNDLTMAMKQIVRDTSAYYLLGYNSTFTATDGKFHEIKVRVKRPGVQVRARKGYWAFTVEDAKRALSPPKADPPKAVETALSAIAAPVRSSRLVRTWIGTERGTAGKTRVTIVWEPVARGAGAPAQSAATPARMAVMAVGPDGAPYFRGKAPEAQAPAAASTAGGAVTFDAAPGKMQLRLAVESADAEVLDSEVREVAVPDLTAADAAMATPEVFRARTVREFQQMKTDPKATPTAAREFSRAERVFVRVITYGSGHAVTARLLNRTGQSIADLPVAPAAAAGDGAHDIDLALAPLAPGEYLVEFTVAGTGGDPIKELVGFRVTG